MSREQAKQFLINLGIEEPTDEQVSNYLNSVSGELNKEKEKADKLKEEASKVKELQKQLDELNKQNMSEVERANAEKEEALANLLELQTQVKKMELKGKLAEQGITGENADKLLDSMKDGGIDVELLGQIISAQKEEAVNQKVAELSAQTIQPNSGSIDTETEKTDADKVVDSIAQSLKSNDSQSVIDAYK